MRRRGEQGNEEGFAASEIDVALLSAFDYVRRCNKSEVRQSMVFRVSPLGQKPRQRKIRRNEGLVWRGLEVADDEFERD